jgi:hypothetical protein
MDPPQTDIGGVNRSVVSSGPPRAATSTVNSPAGGLRVQELQHLLSQLAVMLPEMPFRDTDRAEARAELRTAQAQLGSPRPKLSILRESLQTIRGLLDGIASRDGYGYLVHRMDQLVP